MRVLVGLFMALAGLLPGCGKDVTVPALAAGDLPRLEAAANFPHRGYTIEAGDALQVRYTFHPELNQEVIVQPDGKVTLLQVGDVEAAGRTPRDLEAVLVDKTSATLRNPEIVVTIAKFSDKTIFVGGEVTTPGLQPYRRDLTPLQAVIAAGGFKETARLDSVVLVRSGGPEQFISRRLDLATTVHDGTREPLYLAPHDVLYVPRTRIADANLWVKQHITDLIPLFRGVSMPVPVF